MSPAITCREFEVWGCDTAQQLDLTHTQCLKFTSQFCAGHMGAHASVVYLFSLLKVPRRYTGTEKRL